MLNPPPPKKTIGTKHPIVHVKIVVWSYTGGGVDLHGQPSSVPGMDRPHESEHWQQQQHQQQQYQEPVPHHWQDERHYESPHPTQQQHQHQ
jgi:hypothetical protein